jgi:iron complex transport system ATP-binding protein
MMIEIKKLSFSYDNKKVIDDVTFTVNAGETWVIIGRNGVGKSTLLKCLCGLLKHQQGDVLINGVDIAELTPREIAKQIAYVPQGINRQLPPFTIREYLMMARYPYSNGFWLTGNREDKKCIDDAMELTETVHLADRLMNTLSGGELQSALIAGAMAQGTPFLLLDEPTTYLDPYHQKNICQLIQRIHAQRGTAVITVTHDVNFALSTHNNILALVDGSIFSSGTKEKFCIDAVGNLKKIFSVDFSLTEALTW